MTTQAEPPANTDRMGLVEWRLAQVEKTLARMTSAAWSLVIAVISALIIYYLTSKGGHR